MHTREQQLKRKATDWLRLTYFKDQGQATEELLKQQPMGIGNYRFTSAVGRIPMHVPLFVKRDCHSSRTDENIANSKLSFRMEVFCWSPSRSLTDFPLSGDYH